MTQAGLPSSPRRLRAAVVGTGPEAAARAAVVTAAPGAHLLGVYPDAEALADAHPTPEVLFVAGPTADHYRLAEAATKQGTHVFLAWPPATSLAECEAVVRLAEEAGVEVGVSRPLRFHPALDDAAGRCRLVLLDRAARDAPLPRRLLADLVDLACALTGSSSVKRVDAEAARDGARFAAVAFALRFHNGAYAQATLRLNDPAPTFTCYADGARHLLTPAAYDGLRAETEAFLSALAAGRHAPVSALDGLHTARLVERLMDKLR